VNKNFRDVLMVKKKRKKEGKKRMSNYPWNYYPSPTFAPPPPPPYPMMMVTEQQQNPMSPILKRVGIVLILLLILAALITLIIYVVRSQIISTREQKQLVKQKLYTKAMNELPLVKGTAKMEKAFLCDTELQIPYCCIQSYQGGQLTNEISTTSSSSSSSSWFSSTLDEKATTTVNKNFVPKTIQQYSISNLELMIHKSALPASSAVWTWLRSFTKGDTVVLNKMCLLVVDFSNIEIQRAVISSMVLCGVDFDTSGIRLIFMPDQVQWVPSSTTRFQGEIVNKFITNTTSSVYMPLQFKIGAFDLPHAQLSRPIMMRRAYGIGPNQKYEAQTKIEVSSFSLTIPLEMTSSLTESEKSFFRLSITEGRDLDGVIRFHDQNAFSAKCSQMGFVSMDAQKQTCELFVSSLILV
jgi:hypothetical protein